MSAWPQSCAWCEDGAVERQKVRAGIYAYACPEHVRLLGIAPPEPLAEPEPETRTEPLCSSCFAEITWANLVKDGKRTGKRMPLERVPVHSSPRASLVVFNPRRQTAVVLTKQQATDDAPKWLGAGAELRMSHYATCSSAQRHRRAA